MSSPMRDFVNMAQEHLDRILAQQTMHKNAKSKSGSNNLFKARPNGN